MLNFGDNTITGDYAPTTDLPALDTSFASSGVDQSGSVSYDIAPAGSLLQLDPFLFPAGSASSSDAGPPTGSDLNGPTQPAPQSATAGNPAGNTWAALLGAGAPITADALRILIKSGALQSGLTQLTKATGASVGMNPSGAPVKTLFDTTNQGVTGKQLVFGGIVLFALVYGINKLA